MTVPTTVTWAASVKVAAHTAVRDAIDAGATGGLIRFRDSADVLLGEAILSDPCGTVNGTTGQLTLSIATQEASANASGTIAYGEVCTSAGAVVVALPAQAGAAAVANKLVVQSLIVAIGGAINVLSATIG